MPTGENMTEALKANLITKQEHETINSFFDKIHKATIEGQEWVETTDEILNHYNKGGLGKSGYFIFQNIKVCGYGKSADIQKQEARQLGEILYGESEGKVLQGTSAKRANGE